MDDGTEPNNTFQNEVRGAIRIPGRSQIECRSGRKTLVVVRTLPLFLATALSRHLLP
jgi:hypothetical protein